ncbi:MAG: PTS sugar transporter subunit IIA [Candidatus Aureabacteria bacterium]|nr:PTS sugar transporter subunit IIA [Candidatus Auribacterota bacterium]
MKKPDRESKELLMEQKEELTIREFAKLYKMKEINVKKLIEEHKIPAKKVGKQWKIAKSYLNSWLAKNIKSMSNDKLENIEVDEKNKSIKITPLLNKDNIIFKPNSYSKTQIISELIGRLADIKKLSTDKKEKLVSAVIQRERLCSTAISDGIAIPHPRNSMPDIVDEAYIVLAISKIGIDFEADDGEKSKLFFFLCAPRNDIHLKIMARLSRILRDPMFRHKLIQAEDAETVKTLFSDQEKWIDKK